MQFVDWGASWRRNGWERGGKYTGGGAGSEGEEVLSISGM